MSGENKERHRVCALAYDGLCTFEFGIAVDAFALERPELGIPWYDFRVVSCDPSPLRAAGGIEVVCSHDLSGLQDADTVIIPGWKGVDEPVPAELIGAIRRAHGGGCRLLSICSGVFVLAACGLLSGRRATTHWRYTRHLKERHPDIHVVEDVLYVDAGNGIYTSAGSAAGLDLCLHVIREDRGATVANRVARRFVLPAHREGGQAQFVDRTIREDPRERSFGEILDILRARISEPLTVTEMADLSNMSPRTLLRKFRRSTGLSPGHWLIAERIRLATELLESTSDRVERIADRAGFGSAESLRHHFRRHIGMSPAQYRKAFPGDAGASLELNDTSEADRIHDSLDQRRANPGQGRDDQIEQQAQQGG